MATSEEVAKLASLARLSIAPEKAAPFAAEFESILAYIGQLDTLSIDTKSEPRLPALHNVFREDVDPTPPGLYTERLAAQFPSREGDSLSVKKIISHD